MTRKTCTLAAAYLGFFINFPDILSYYLFFFSLFCFFFLLFLLVCFLKLKIYILIHIRLCGRVSDKNIFTRSISRKKTTFVGLTCIFYSEDFVEFIELHGFADSSNQDYAAVSYAWLITNKEIKVKPLTSKARVAPPKPLTIPRLQLLS